MEIGTVVVRRNGKGWGGCAGAGGWAGAGGVRGRGGWVCGGEGLCGGGGVGGCFHARTGGAKGQTIGSQDHFGNINLCYSPSTFNRSIWCKRPQRDNSKHHLCG